MVWRWKIKLFSIAKGFAKRALRLPGGGHGSKISKKKKSIFQCYFYIAKIFFPSGPLNSKFLVVLPLLASLIGNISINGVLLKVGLAVALLVGVFMVWAGLGRDIPRPNPTLSRLGRVFLLFFHINPHSTKDKVYSGRDSSFLPLSPSPAHLFIAPNFKAQVRPYQASGWPNPWIVGTCLAMLF